MNWTGTNSLKKLVVKSWMKSLICHWYPHKLGKIQFTKNYGKRLALMSLKIFICLHLNWPHPIIPIEVNKYQCIIEQVGTLHISPPYLSLYNIIYQMAAKIHKSDAQKCSFQDSQNFFLAERMKCHNLNYILVWNMVLGNWCICVLLRFYLEKTGTPLALGIRAGCIGIPAFWRFSK